jgi:hypothetical protein
MHGDVPEAVSERLDVLRDEYAYECVDNLRVARADDAESVALYETQREHGCCGSHDEVVTVDGAEWWIGFNYGH